LFSNDLALPGAGEFTDQEITGTVIDDSDIAPGTDVAAIYAGCSTTYEATSASDGKFTFLIPANKDFTPSEIHATFTKDGYNDAHRTIQIGGLPMSSTKHISDTYITKKIRKGSFVAEIKDATQRNVLPARVTLTNASGEEITELQKIPAGNYQALAEVDGYYGLIQEVIVKAGEETKFRSSMVVRATGGDVISVAARNAVSVRFLANEHDTCELGETALPSCGGARFAGKQVTLDQVAPTYYLFETAGRSVHVYTGSFDVNIVSFYGEDGVKFCMDGRVGPMSAVQVNKDSSLSACADVYGKQEFDQSFTAVDAERVFQVNP
jgi:peptidoglycan hydrolase-like protein with peptidoglycan-binding domain